MTNHHDLVRFKDAAHDPEYTKLTLGQLVADAHQAVLNRPGAKDDFDQRAMLLLELAYARLEGTPC